MHFIADLHIHSKYSRATSKEMTPENIWKWSQLKGVKVVGTGDFTHPAWCKELQEKLEPVGNGLLCLKKDFKSKDIPASCATEVYFLLSSEVSCIYNKKGKTRKIHLIILVRDFSSVARLNLILSKIGNLAADGRPILGIDAKEILKIVVELSEDCLLIPAHVWTPHFSIFGAESGFDSIEECFEELTPYVYAVETGLSSNPVMNWRLSFLDHVNLVSNSDAHSPSKLGREANIFDTDLNYSSIISSIKTKKGVLGTIEFFPEEGKYHYDGHRLCGISLSPQETIKYNYLCPLCGKKLTVGVMHRVERLADRKDGYKPPHASRFYSIIPLPEILAETLKVGVTSKAVEKEYSNLIQKLGSEFKILMDIPLEEIERASSTLIKEAIFRVRTGNVHIAPGFDGEYGKIKIFEPVERKKIKGQAMLF